MLGRRIEGNQPVSSIGKDFNQVAAAQASAYSTHERKE